MEKECGFYATRKRQIWRRLRPLPARYWPFALLLAALLLIAGAARCHGSAAAPFPGAESRLYGAELPFPGAALDRAADNAGIEVYGGIGE